MATKKNGAIQKPAVTDKTARMVSTLKVIGEELPVKQKKALYSIARVLGNLDQSLSTSNIASDHYMAQAQVAEELLVVARVTISEQNERIGISDLASINQQTRIDDLEKCLANANVALSKQDKTIDNLNPDVKISNSLDYLLSNLSKEKATQHLEGFPQLNIFKDAQHLVDAQALLAKLAKDQAHIFPQLGTLSSYFEDTFKAIWTADKKCFELERQLKTQASLVKEESKKEQAGELFGLFAKEQPFANYGYWVLSDMFKTGLAQEMQGAKHLKEEEQNKRIMQRLVKHLEDHLRVVGKDTRYAKFATLCHQTDGPWGESEDLIITLGNFNPLDNERTPTPQVTMTEHFSLFAKDQPLMDENVWTVNPRWIESKNIDPNSFWGSLKAQVTEELYKAVRNHGMGNAAPHVFFKTADNDSEVIFTVSNYNLVKIWAYSQPKNTHINIIPLNNQTPTLY